MYKVCEKCGFMYDDAAGGCPQCGANANQNNNQGAPVVANGGYTNNGFGSFSTSSSTVKSTRSSSGGMDIKKIAIIAIAIVVSVALIVVGVLVIPKLLKADGDKLGANDVEAGESSYVSDVAGEDDEADANADVDPDATSLYMPSCNGWSLDQVNNYFKSMDCEIKYEYTFSSDVPINCVVEQSLEPGAEINPGTVIVLEISKGEDDCPYEYQQKIVVSGSGNSSNASLELFVWENGEWVSKYSCGATVGKNGIGNNYGEGKGVTPAGTYKLGVVLSQGPISNDTWPNRVVSENTCIVDDASSSFYNTIMDIRDLPDNVGYDDIGNTIINGNSDKVMYIEHNGDGINTDGVVAGKGSAITICGKSDSLYATAGCIDISDDDFDSILSLLDYSMNPHIEITM